MNHRGSLWGGMNFIKFRCSSRNCPRSHSHPPSLSPALALIHSRPHFPSLHPLSLSLTLALLFPSLSLHPSFPRSLHPCVCDAVVCARLCACCSSDANNPPVPGLWRCLLFSDCYLVVVLLTYVTHMAQTVYHICTKCNTKQILKIIMCS